MDITQIPFSKHLRLKFSHNKRGDLMLEFDETMKNHLGIFHAGAQFCLAESMSGLALQQHFPELEEEVIPMLRKSEVKYSRPAESTIYASADIDPDEKMRFKKMFDKKGRALIRVPVTIRDEAGTITMTGIYEWFIKQR